MKQKILKFVILLFLLLVFSFVAGLLSAKAIGVIFSYVIFSMLLVIGWYGISKLVLERSNREVLEPIAIIEFFIIYMPSIAHLHSHVIGINPTLKIAIDLVSVISAIVVTRLRTKQPGTN